jgi:hypothetical protein
MAYILGLFLIIAIMFSYVTDNNIVGDTWSRIKDKTTATIFPKSDREILIDNLDSDYSLMDRFFSPDIIGDILESDDITSETKKVILGASDAFNNSKSSVKTLGEIAKNEKSITKALIQKIFNLEDNTSLVPNPDPTNIPPNCQLQCSEE